VECLKRLALAFDRPAVRRRQLLEWIELDPTVLEPPGTSHYTVDQVRPDREGLAGLAG